MARQQQRTVTKMIVQSDVLHDAVRPDDTARDPRELRIELLGGFRITVGSRVLDESDWYLRKAKSLVKLLVLAPNHRMHRGQIVDVLWPEFGPDSAANNLHKALHMARRALEPDLPTKTPSLYLHMSGEFVTLDSPYPLWIDVEAFRAAAERAALANDPEAYEEALSLYTGDLLPEDRYEDWAIRQREQLQEAHGALLLDLADIREQRGEIDAAIEVLRQVVAADPAHEQAQGGLMRLLTQAGYRQLALRQYQQLRDALRRELDAEPDAGIQKLHQQILNGDLALHLHPVPAATSRETAVEDRSLIGREHELEALQASLDRLFAGRGGVVFVTGEAGIGKSRLVSEVAEQATRRGAIHMWGAAYKRKKPVPYGLFAVALEGFALRIAPETLEGLLGPSTVDIAPLAPAVCAALDLDPPAPLSDSAETRWRLRNALGDLFTRLCQDAPVVLVLEDLHAADEASLFLLDHLAHAVQDMPVLCLCTARSSEIEDESALEDLHHKLEGERVALSLPLRSLDWEEMATMAERLLGGSVDRPVLQTLEALAQGNPYYIHEVVAALRGRRRICETNGVWRVRNGIVLAWERDHLRRPRGTAGDYRLAPRLRVATELA